MSTAVAAVAAEIMPGRPPVNAIMTAIENDAYRPTLGSTPAIKEKAIASGMSAKATTSPANISPRILPNHSPRKGDVRKLVKKLLSKRGTNEKARDHSIGIIRVLG